MFTNLILSTLIGLNSLNPNPLHKFSTENLFKQNSAIICMTLWDSTYKDIFLCTMPNLIGPHEYNSIQWYPTIISTNIPYVRQGKNMVYSYSYVTIYYTQTTLSYSEGNPIANFLFTYNLWVPSYIGVNFINSGIISYLNHLDNSGISGYVYSLAVALVEMGAIYSWRIASNGITDIKVEVPVFTYQF
jgi:hypothetical protein